MPAKLPYKTTTFEPSSIETIDFAIYEWLNKNLDLHTTTNKGWQKTPVIWLGTERAYQLKNNKELRDEDDQLALPIIALTRESIAKDLQFKGSFQASIPEDGDYRGGAISITRRIKQDKTRNFANANKARKYSTGNETGRSKNNKIVYETITIPAPTYITVMYDVHLKAEYQQQINDLTQPFISKIGQTNSFYINYDGHRYEAFVEQDFTENKNIKELGEDERLFETTIKIKVLGFLIGEGKNREKPKITVRENRVQVRISRERVIVGDKRPWIEDDFDYRD